MVTPFEQLESLKNVESNWDSYGADAPRTDAIETAKQFLINFPGIKRLAFPYVCPTRIGGVLFAWHQGPHELEIEFDSSGKASFAYLNTATDESASGKFNPQEFSLQKSVLLPAIVTAFPVPVAA